MRSVALAPVIVEGIAFWAARLPGWEVARAVIRGEATPPEATAQATRACTARAHRAAARTRHGGGCARGRRACMRCGAARRRPSCRPFLPRRMVISRSATTCVRRSRRRRSLLSPTKFHNSVHNAAAGYWSIGTGSYAPYTAISAYRYTFAAGLLETLAQVVSEGRPILLVAFDIESTGALATMATSQGVLGVALVSPPMLQGGGIASDCVARWRVPLRRSSRLRHRPRPQS